MTTHYKSCLFYFNGYAERAYIIDEIAVRIDKMPTIFFKKLSSFPRQVLLFVLIAPKIIMGSRYKVADITEKAMINPIKIICTGMTFLFGKTLI